LADSSTLIKGKYFAGKKDSTIFYPIDILRTMGKNPYHISTR